MKGLPSCQKADKMISHHKRGKGDAIFDSFTPFLMGSLELLELVDHFRQLFS
jgi:hypothetical protein